MSKPYFRYVPNFEYVNRLGSNQTISAYIQTKNLFKRGILREDIFTDLAYFTKYTIVGDDRPDNVAFKVYNSQYYDWLVLMCNNVICYQDEWPLNQKSFESYLLSKYPTYEDRNKIHHYETVEVLDQSGFVVVPKGLEVDKDFSITYHDTRIGVEITRTGITQEYTNYDYEVSLEDAKRNIYLLKPDYVDIIERDLRASMIYRKGSSQYVDKNLVRGENIRLFQP
jgi:hypothetical protein